MSQIKIRIIKIVFYIIISTFLFYTFKIESIKIFNIALAYLGVVVGIQIGAFSLIVGILETNLLKELKNNEDASNKLKELFDEFAADTRIVILLGLFVFILIFELTYFKNKVIILLYKPMICSVYFAGLLILDTIFESINVILTIGKSRIDITNRKL